MNAVPNAYGPRTTFVGAHPYPPPPPKAGKAPKTVKVPLRTIVKFNYVLAVRRKPGLTTTILQHQSGQDRRYVTRALRKLASKGAVHGKTVPGCGKEHFWYPGPP